MENIIINLISQGILLGIAGYFIARAIGKMDTWIDKISESVAELTTMTKIHEHRLDDHDDDIKELKEARIVRYKKA